MGNKNGFLKIQILDKEGNLIEKNENENENQNIIFFDFKNLNYETKFKFNELLNPINFMTWLIVSVKDIL